MTHAGGVEPLATSRPPDAPLSGVERVSLLLITLTVASTCFLTSAGSGVEEGHVAWGRNSVLHVITDLTNLTQQFPTARGTEVKWLTQAVGAAALLICAAAAWFIRTRRDPDMQLDHRPVDAGGVEGGRPFAWLTGMPPTTAAQVALALFVGLSAVSAFWSPWAEASVYGAVRLGMGVLLAVSIGHCLGVRAARRGAMYLAVALVAVAVIGIWYYYERNPVQRLKYPIGNPIFFAACLLPALTLLGAWIVSQLIEHRRSVPGDPRGVRRYPGIAAAAAGVVLLVWALVKADSRGPGIGLALGLFGASLLIASNRTRMVLVAGAVIAAVMFASLKLWPVSWLLSRPDTLRLRLYAWKYALQLFLSRPDIGRGQGSYLLLAQSMSRPDAERDPLAFPGGNLLGNAHNEWLEILAELGAMGLALMITAIGVTLWAGLLAWRAMDGRHPSDRDRTAGAPNPQAAPSPAVHDRCILFGLIAGFLAMVFESASDVGLRMPGLPVIFYTVWGLLWAMSRAGAPRPPASRAPGPRVVGLVAAIAGAWFVMIVAARDWQAALAEPNVAKYATQYQWDRSLEAAAEAARDRLSVDARLSALYRAARVARDAAAHRVQQLHGMLERAEEANSEMAPVIRLAHEDVQSFEKYFDVGARASETLLSYCPMYPGAAAFLSDLWLLRAQVNAAQEQTGPLPLTSLPTDPIEQARLWLQREFQGDRLNPELGLALLRLSHGQPMLDQLNMLRIPIRSGPIHPAVEPAIAALMTQPEFGAAIEALLAAARPAAAGTSPWPDAYSPETLRLTALAYKRRGGFEQAAAMSGQAVQLLDQIRDRFPTNAAYAMSDQAEYLLLGDPGHPERALAAIGKALELWPEHISVERRHRLERDLVIYLAAGGGESQARQVLSELLGAAATPQNIEQNLGMAFAELCQRFMPFAPDQRPAAFKDWLQRALTLAPRQAEPLILAATTTLEQGQQDRALDHLKTLDDLIQNPQQFAALLRSLIDRFPDARGLQGFAAARFPELGQATQPAGPDRAPTTLPSIPATQSGDLIPGLE